MANISLIGILLLLVFFCIFLFITNVAMRHMHGRQLVDYTLVGRHLSFPILSASLLVAWTWTTSIIGSAEAGIQYGISGGINYTVWANLVFILFIPMVIRLRRIMPEAITITEFIGERFNLALRKVFYIFTSLVAMYVLLEQAIGVATVFLPIFHIPFKITVFCVVMMVTVYVTWGSMQGSVFNDVFLLFLIMILFAVIIGAFLVKFDLNFIYHGIVEKAAELPSGESQAYLSVWSLSGFKYGIIAFVVSMGQVFLNQGYFSKAYAAKSSRTVVWGFVAGIFILWMPIPLLSSVVFGHAAIAYGAAGYAGSSTYLVFQNFFSMFSLPYLIIFAILMLAIGIGASANCLLGVQTVFMADFYAAIIKEDASDEEKIRFGRIITVCIGLLCAFIAIALDGIPLLKIDTFCGIFFAAPSTVLFLSCYMEKLTAKTATVALVLGLAAGLGTWVFVPNGWFLGTVLSFLVPVCVILAASVFTQSRFNFARLKFYKL